MPHRPYRRLLKQSPRGLAKFMGALELEVMNSVWRRRKATVRQVLGDLQQAGGRPAYTTVMTTMTRLAEKGFLLRNKQGKAFVYRPAHTKKGQTSALASEVARAFLRDFGQVAVAQFAKELDRVDPELVAELAKLAGEDTEHEPS